MAQVFNLPPTTVIAGWSWGLQFLEWAGDLGGFCPGPAIANLGALRVEALVFVPMMAIGMLVFQRFFGAIRERGIGSSQIPYRSL